MVKALDCHQGGEGPLFIFRHFTMVIYMTNNNNNNFDVVRITHTR
jgi:hypothetical protein